jgi:hypothetical protein
MFLRRVDIPGSIRVYETTRRHMLVLLWEPRATHARDVVSFHFASTFSVLCSRYRGTR